MIAWSFSEPGMLDGTRPAVKLSGADVRSIRVPVPDPDVQHSVIRQLDAIDRPHLEVVEKLRRELALLQEFRTRLVADVVTGQVDVRAVAATLPDAPEPASDAGDDLDDALAVLADAEGVSQDATATL